MRQNRMTIGQLVEKLDLKRFRESQQISISDMDNNILDIEDVKRDDNGNPVIIINSQIIPKKDFNDIISNLEEFDSNLNDCIKYLKSLNHKS